MTNKRSRLFTIVCRHLMVLAWVPLLANAQSNDQEAPASDPVTVSEDERAFVLSNGIVTATILKSNGDIRSLKFKGNEVFTDQSGHAGGYWSHDTRGGMDLIPSITINPDTNGGRRAEVSVKGISGGVKMGHGPGAGPDGDFPADIDIRYSIGRSESGVYTYCVFDHLPEYPAATMTEARFAAKLASHFDWISVDEKRNKHYPSRIPGEDKYVYTALQSENRAFGFSSTTQHMGFYFVNPTIEYLSGGPTKPEFLCHRDTTRVQAPVVLNYWRSSHYGGATVSVAAGEHWVRVVGPFLLYVNEGESPMAMWREARAQADREASKWPYDWVDAGNYAKPSERTEVSGRFILNDSELSAFPGAITVGLAQPTYEVLAGRGGTQKIQWQTDAKHYQFWAVSNDTEGRFTIPNVSSGSYTLYAFAEGILDEFSKAEIKVNGTSALSLGDIEWKPVRRGRQLWEIGIANRSGKEFAGGDRFFDPDIVLQYPKLFPNDVTYTVGTSDFSKDWFFAHVPHNKDPQARVVPFRGVSGAGRATPYRVEFELESPPIGTAFLRLAICGTGTRFLDVSVNDKPVGKITLGRSEGVLTRHQVQGLWYERDLAFDATLLTPGMNQLTLTVPAGNPASGVVYDYLRLELDDA
ncbi:MAG: hypothetical protein KDN22_13215 [Verrucomicrobiae bacterium]|nr:hypothetical protein [Verrucomicrobiae bacterium]